MNHSPTLSAVPNINFPAPEVCTVGACRSKKVVTSPNDRITTMDHLKHPILNETTKDGASHQTNANINT
jgi:hypothetical protein